MSKGLMVALSGLCIIGIVVTGIGMIGVGYYNDFTTAEQTIVAQYDQNRNDYDNMYKKFREVAQVPTMYADDLKKVYDAAIQGRYGKDGSHALMQFIKEQNPTLDGALYRQLAETIEAGRNAFEADQKSLIDRKRAYQTQVHRLPGAFVAGLLGFPRIDLAKYGIVTSDVTEEAFTTKRTAPMEIR